MKKTKLFKSLLVAAALCVGASAWADDVYETVYTRAAVSDWTSDDKTDWNASSAVEVSSTNGLGANANLTATYVSKTFTIGSKYKVKYEVDWTFACATGRDVNWNWIQFGDFLRIGINSTYNMQVSTNAGSTWNATALAKYSNNTFTKHIEVIFDTQYNTIELFKWDGEDKTSLVEGTYNNATFNKVSTGFVRGGSVSWTLANYITTITVSQAEKAAAEAANYTINYIYDNTTIKSETGEGDAGAQITAEKVITVDGVKYLCTAATAPSITLAAGDNTLDVPVRLPYTATLNVTTTIGDGEPATVTTNLVETDDKDCSWSYAYPLYVESEGVYYVADVTSSFGETGIFADGETINKEVKYSTANANVVYFGEPNETTGNNVAFSNGSTGYITGGVVYTSDKVIRLGVLPVGTYMLTVNVTGDPNRNVVLGDCSDTSVFPTAIVTFTGTGLQSQVFTLAEDTPISISGKDQGSGKFNQSSTLDYIVLKKIVSMSIVGDFSANGWEPDQGIALTQDANNPAIWKTTVEDFVITSEKWNYEYKAVANGNWSDYVLGKANSNDNQNYNFESAGAGTYYLMFTANTTNHTVELAIEQKHDYTLVGCFNNDETAGFFGTAWDTNAADNLLTRHEDGTYTKEFKDVELEAGTIMYKVVQDHAWTTTWGFPATDTNPNGNADYVVTTAGTYNIIFTFNPNATLSNGYNLSCEIIPSSVNKTITAAKYATCCSPYALDFTGSALTAYVAVKDADNMVTFTSITKVPANTGILLKGDAGDYTISTTTGDTEPVTNNALHGVLEDTQVVAGSFVLMNGSKGVGFYRTENAFTVGANTAYIEALPTTARTFIDFDFNDATAIEGAAAEKMMNGEVYNLQGQRVMNAKKGLYIINGKKVVIK